MFKVSNGQRIVLASSSPRRRELLSGCGLTFEIRTPDIDEDPRPGEDPGQLVKRLAREKGEVISREQPDVWVIAADTTVVLGDEILNKPRDRSDAARMLGSLQGEWHAVWGGVAILHGARRIAQVDSYISQVFMNPLSASEIDSYINSGEPLDRAGSYAIQGIGAALIGEVKGSYTNIVGLNLPAVLQVLKRFQVIETS